MRAFLHRLLALVGRSSPAPVPRRRRLRCVCEYCGKDLAVVASTGRLWRHRCGAPDRPNETPLDTLAPRQEET